MSQQYASHLGHFSPDGRSYTITSARTPHDWKHYLFNETFLASVDMNAAGLSFFKRPDGTRTNLILDNSIPRRIYVRDMNSGRLITLPRTAGCTLTITPGVAVFRVTAEELEIQWSLSTPAALRGEAWRIIVRNTSKRPRELVVAGMFPLCPHGYGTPFGYDGSMALAFERALNAIVLTNNDPDRPDPLYNAYMMQDAEVESFDTSTATFFGDGSADSPAGMAEGKLANRLNISSPLHAGKIAALASRHNLAAGEEVCVQMLVGVAADAAEVASIRQQWFSEPTKLASAISERQESFLGLTRRVQIHTPDEEFDRLFNGWLGYNLCFTSRWTRLYSRGFRDCMQDTQGVAAIDAPQARANLLEAMPHIYRSGRCRRAWAAGPGALLEQYYADQPVWVAPAIKAYLAETGDVQLLDEVRPWFDGGEATVWEHLMACQRHLYRDRGSHGLCLIHDGDWCDTAHRLGIRGIGEGIWLSMAYHKSLLDVIEIAQWLGRRDEAAEMRGYAREISSAVNEHGWDGKWFALAYNDDGRLIGTHRDQEGRIFLNPQTWSVISAVTDAERQRLAMSAVDELLDSWVGPHLLAPPFTHPDKSIGALTGFHPGTTENGSCYCHAAAFKIVADCLAGRGDRAFETFRRIMPGGDADQRVPGASCPPFAFTNSRVAASHPYDAGRHGSTWVTGTITWCFQAASEYILGARRTLEGLVIDPCVPSTWKQFSIQRQFRGASYDIAVTNPDGVQKGLTSLFVDGKKMEGNRLPLFESGHHGVQAVMG